MPRKLLTLLVTILSISAGAAAPTSGDTPLTIGLIGDSTVADTYGWGPSFALHVTDKAKVLNYAKNGATLMSLSGRLDELLLLKPDYVLIQFGHNDQKKYTPDVYATKLTGYVERIRKAGGKPVIVSSVTRRGFGEDGRIKPANDQAKFKAPLPDYAKAAGIVAGKEGVPFIDLYSISVAHHNKIGPEESKTYNYNADDRTHFSKKGADAIAELVVAELKKVVPGIAGYLK